jgi:hypothetical protein
VGVAVEDVVEEHAPISAVQAMSGVVKRIDPSRSTALAHTGLFVIENSLCL